MAVQRCKEISSNGVLSLLWEQSESTEGGNEMKLVYAVLYAVGLIVLTSGFVVLLNIMSHLFGLWFDILITAAVFIIIVLIIAASDSEDKGETK